MTEFVPLQELHLDFRIAEEKDIERDWFVLHMRDIVAYEQKGCFALLENDQPVGMITTTRYGKAGWLGWLYVKESERQRGLGEKLMLLGIEYLESCGCSSVLLEAVFKAAPLYARLGFERQFITHHYRLEREAFKPVSSEGITISPFTQSDLESVALFDSRYSHVDRQALFGVVLGNPTFAGWVARKDRRVVGFMGRTLTQKNQQIGPLVVDPTIEPQGAVASALASAAFEVDHRLLYIRCPEVDPDRATDLTQIGCEQREVATVRMVRGERPTAEFRGVLCLGCPGKG